MTRRARYTIPAGQACIGTTLAPGKSCNITVNLRPTAARFYSATLEVDRRREQPAGDRQDVADGHRPVGPPGRPAALPGGRGRRSLADDRRPCRGRGCRVVPSTRQRPRSGGAAGRPATLPAHESRHPPRPAALLSALVACGERAPADETAATPTETPTAAAGAAARRALGSISTDLSKKPAIPKPSGNPPAQLQTQDVVTERSRGEGRRHRADAVRGHRVVGREAVRRLVGSRAAVHLPARQRQRDTAVGTRASSG